MRIFNRSAVSFAVLLTLSGFVFSTDGVVGQQEKTNKCTLKVEGMTCGACTKAVKSALESVPGVKTADVSLSDETAVVEFEKGRATPDQLTEAVKKIGFKASVAETAEPKEAEIAKATIAGKLICIGCTLKSTHGAQAQCSVYGHKGGLLTADGTLYTFVENDRSKELVNSTELHNKDLKVTGTAFPKANYIDVESYEVDGVEYEWCPRCKTMTKQPHTH
ncbi:MAG: heavy-metal-associated domain-containing protein [bacterium]